MLSTGLDQGLKGACLNQRREITIPDDLGRINIVPEGMLCGYPFQFI